MAIDIRATVSCSLGTLISASISDDYVQGTGLIKCKGSCEISGIATPAIGTVVTFSYTKGGVTRSIPRKLRVLSSFADPFRRTTKVELGCKLTYLSDLQEPIKWKPADDPQNSSLTDADAEIITFPIFASSVAGECLSKLGITTSGSLGLSNSFSVAEFDFGAGYVSVLSDLLVSESRCGYLNASEQLVVFDILQDGGTGPVLDSSKIIDLGSIGVGPLPGEAVVVSYSTLKLKNANEAGTGAVAPAEEATKWTANTTSDKGQVTVAYSVNGGAQQTATFNTLDRTQENTNYTELTKKSTGEKLNVVTSKRVDTTRSAVSVLGSVVSEYLNNGITFINNDVESTTSTFFYYDEEVNETLSVSETYGSLAYAYGAVNLPMVFSASNYVPTPSGSVSYDYLLERQVVETYTNGNYRKIITRTYGPWLKTLSGQQTIAASRDSFTTATQVSTFVGNAARGCYLIDVSIRTELATSNVQVAPSKQDRVNEANADPNGNPNNGYRTDSTSSLELALGSPTAQRRIELSLPKAPDDRFLRSGTAPNYTYTAIKSDAEAKAARYGRAQNALLLGNRSGMNVQTAPELLPEAPFAPVVVQANGLSALYRTNGTNWQMDASGVLVSSDLLFWGAVGGTGSFWFPVAPGITSLPTTPAVVGGQMTVSATVPVWNETVAAVGRTSTKLAVTSLPYALTLLTEATVTTRTKLVANKIVSVNVPLATISLAPVTPSVALGAAVAVPTTSIAMTPLAPAVVMSTVVAVPLSTLSIGAFVPEQTGADSAIVLVPTTTIGITAQVPEGVGANLETYWNSWRLQALGMDAWVYPDWWAD